MKQLFDDVSFKCSKLVTKTIVLHWRYICFRRVLGMLYTVFTVLALLMKLWIPFMVKEELINDFEKNIINHLKRG
jgi:hypothetical protein